MTATPLPNPRFYQRDPDDDTPLVGGKVYFYIPGTVVAKAIYANSAKSAELSNPVILEADGGANIYIEGEYDVAIYRSDDTLVKAIDNVLSGSSATGTLTGAEVEYAANHTIDATEDGLKIIGNNPSGLTFSFDPAADLGETFSCIVYNNGTGDITLDPDASETIGEQTTVTLYPEEAAIVTSNGTELRCFKFSAAEIGQAIANLSALDSIASAATTDLSTVAAPILNVTGTNAITALGTVKAGVVKFLIFADALPFTHNASSLILPDGVNITTAAGHCAIMVSLGSGNWRCISYSGNEARVDLANTFTANQTISGSGDARLTVTGTDTGGVIIQDSGGGADQKKSEIYTEGNSIVIQSLDDDDTVQTEILRLIRSTGQLRAGNGSESVPAYSFQNDTDTGMWADGGGLRLSYAGTTELQITATGFIAPNVANATTGNAANVWVDNATSVGELRRSTSSVRYKTDLAPITDEEVAASLTLEPFTYLHIGEEEQGRRFGLSAEEVHDAGLTQLVTYRDIADLPKPDNFTEAEYREYLNKYGTMAPDYVQYDRLVPILLKAVKDLTTRIEELETA